jgi:predicted HTH domain antitoxin
VKNLGDKISIILPDDLKKEIDKLRDLNQEDQSSFIRKLLWKSVTHEKLEIALKEYLSNKISLGKAAENAGISIWEMLDELKSRNITLNYKISEAELEIEKILKRYKKI